MENWKTRVVALVVALIVFSTGSVTYAEPVGEVSDEVSYNLDIRPLLSSKCFSCHGPDAEGRKAGLRLDQPDGDEGSHEYAIVPGDVDGSEVWSRIASDDPDVVMPPPDSHLKTLSKDEQQLIRRWIEAGAKYEKHWAFVPPKKTVELDDRVSSNSTAATIDLLVRRQLRAKGLSSSLPADARTLVRRVTLDLTGLPPTRQEIRSFLADYSRSPALAWEQLVDDLLARPQYGEHMARHWLDLVRFADTNGMHKDFYRNHIAYRDWVIRSFNENLPYDDFVKYQLAGDLYEAPTRDQLVASGFHRLHLIIDRGTALPEESHFKNVLDRVTAVGTAFMGLTVQCAQCHDHKFDPISQKDFYSLYAFFNNIDAASETHLPEVVDGLQQPFVRWPTSEQTARLAALDQDLAKLDNESKQVSKAMKLLQEQTSESESRERAIRAIEEWQSELVRQTRRVRAERLSVERTVDKAMIMKERSDVRETRVLVRGQYDNPGEIVQRGTPEFLPPLKTDRDIPSRMDLAEWFVAESNPLTARVAVNRFWQLFFGAGLVKTSEDFGNQGTTPSHPELLDELTISFVESGWDIKSLVKQIVMSETYRQSSHASPERFRADAENRLLARGPRYRLDAEIIRDQILATSGSLNRSMFGRSVKPPQPDGLWKAVSMTGERFRADEGEDIYRRSIYTFWKRAMPPPQMTILNAPIRDACIARRERTNTPTQALLLLNEPEYLRAARRLAQSALELPDDQRLTFVWETVTTRLPDDSEQSIMQSLLEDLLQKYKDEPEVASKMCEGVELESDPARAELAAWTMVCSTIYNLDITKTKD